MPIDNYTYLALRTVAYKDTEHYLCRLCGAYVVNIPNDLLGTDLHNAWHKDVDNYLEGVNHGSTEG